MPSDPFILTSVTEKKMHLLAQRLARFCQSGDVIALFGDLGAGKTVFSRAFIRSLTQQDEEVPSPTFTLVQTYEGIGANECSQNIWHFDLYRLKSAEEIYEIGFEEALSDGISLIEWPQRAGSLLPKNRLEIYIQSVENAPNERLVTIKPFGTQWEKTMEHVKTCLND